MRAVIQRVSRAEVRIDGNTEGKIQAGLVVLLAVHENDDESDADWLVDKICSLRIFPNEAGKFDRSIEEIEGEVLLVSQFTLYGDCRKGRRPSFDASAAPGLAFPLYEKAVQRFMEKGLHTETGEFGAMMEVDLVNDGPVTLIVDSPIKTS